MKAHETVAENYTDNLLYQARAMARLTASFEKHGTEVQELQDEIVATLPEGAALRFVLCAESFDINLSGSKVELVELVRILRRRGYEPSSRPSEGATDWSVFWTAPEGWRT